MANDRLVSTVHSRGTGIPNRSLNSARNHHWVIDGSHDPEAVSTVESFLAGISACGVTLTQGLAEQAGTPLASIDVSIEGVRLAEDTSRFQEINMRFELGGVSQAQAEELTAAYQQR